MLLRVSMMSRCLGIGGWHLYRSSGEELWNLFFFTQTTTTTRRIQLYDPHVQATGEQLQRVLGRTEWPLLE
jgi:hypothetical protein